jgi:exonuclease V
LNETRADADTKLNGAIDDETDVSNTGVAQSDIIGSRQFLYNEDLLNVHTANILQWWHGKREPRGVPIHLSRRCLYVNPRFLPPESHKTFLFQYL